jgi:Uma2 family endonuclease
VLQPALLVCAHNGGYTPGMTIVFNPPVRTIADLLHRLGDIPPERIRYDPVPGTARIEDLLVEGNRKCELIDQTLVEKPMGLRESLLAAWLVEIIGPFIRKHNLGIRTGEEGPFQLLSGLVRKPDFAFVSWDRLPGRTVPDEPFPDVAPDLAVEVLSPSNTRAEMARKRGEYFHSGVRLLWEIDPRARTVRVYTSETAFTDLTAADSLDGRDVLPGLSLPVAELFAELDRHG